MKQFIHTPSPPNTNLEAMGLHEGLNMSQPFYFVYSCLRQWTVPVPGTPSTKEYTDLAIFIDSRSFPFVGDGQGIMIYI